LSSHTILRLSVIGMLAFWAFIYYMAGLFGIMTVIVFYVGLAILGAVVSGVLGAFLREDKDGD